MRPCRTRELSLAHRRAPFPETLLAAAIRHGSVGRMTKLYFAPSACSLSPHIALREAGLEFELVRVDFMRDKRTSDGGRLTDVNPKGYLPVLALDDGRLLTEGAAIVQFIADQRPASGLAPPPGTFERVRLQEWLNFIATEIHKGLSPLYAPKANEEYREVVRSKVAGRLGFLAGGLAKTPYLLGDTFTVADGYAFYVMRSWRRLTRTDLPPDLQPYYARIASRPAVKAALRAEGLAEPAGT